MSDLFGSLAARSLGKADVVRPRVPSLYEPAAGASMRFSEDGESARVEKKRSHPDAMPSEVGDRQGRAEVEDPHIARTPMTAASPLRAQTISGALLETKAATKASDPMTNVVSPRADTVASAGNHAFSEATSLSGSALLAAIVKDGNSDRVLPAASPQTRRLDAIEPFAAAPLDVASQLAKLFRDEPAADTDSVTSRTAHVEQRSASQHGAILGEAVGRRTESPVQITIGRVEVRAIFPEGPAQQNAARPAAKTLSLDDYLTGRSRGTR